MIQQKTLCKNLYFKVHTCDRACNFNIVSVITMHIKLPGSTLERNFIIDFHHYNKPGFTPKLSDEVWQKYLRNILKLVFSRTKFYCNQYTVRLLCFTMQKYSICIPTYLSFC